MEPQQSSFLHSFSLFSPSLPWRFAPRPKGYRTPPHPDYGDFQMRALLLLCALALTTSALTWHMCHFPNLDNKNITCTDPVFKEVCHCFSREFQLYFVSSASATCRSSLASRARVAVTAPRLSARYTVAASASYRKMVRAKAMIRKECLLRTRARSAPRRRVQVARDDWSEAERDVDGR